MKDFQAIRSEPSKLFLRSMLILGQASQFWNTCEKENYMVYRAVKGLNIAKQSEWGPVSLHWPEGLQSSGSALKTYLSASACLYDVGSALAQIPLQGPIIGSIL